MTEFTAAPIERDSTLPEITVDTALHFGSVQEAAEHGYTFHVALSSKLDAKIHHDATEIVLLSRQYRGDIALVRREDTAYFDVFTKDPEESEKVDTVHVQPPLARRMARVLFRR